MALSNEIVAQPEFVEADLTYTVDTGVKPVTGTTVPSGRLRQRSGTFEQHRVRIRNGRLGARDFAFDRDGFVLVDHDTAVADFYDEHAPWRGVGVQVLRFRDGRSLPIYRARVVR